MCGVSGAGGATACAGTAPVAAQQASLDAPTTSTAGGGGIAAGGSGSGQLVAALQQVVSAVQQLVIVLGGTSGGGGPAPAAPAAQQGAAGGPEMLGIQAPVAATTTPAAGAYAQMDSKTLLGPNVVDATVQNEHTAHMNHKADGSVAKSMFNRTVPEDRNKAAAIVQRLMQSTAKYQDPEVAKAAGFDFTKHKLEGGGLLHVSRQGNGLDLDEPNMLLYRKTGESYQLIGVVLTANKTAPDLGMGTWHTHDGKDDLMKHVWFSPNDLDVAFQENTPTPEQV